MKMLFILGLSAAILSACQGPKYVYDYNTQPTDSYSRDVNSTSF